MLSYAWKVKTGLVLLISSIMLTVLHVALFRDAQTFFFYIALDIAFVPIQVLLVTVIIEHLLNEREKRLVLQRLNMVIGAFFGEAGNHLMRQMSATCTDFSALKQGLAIGHDWDRAHFKAAAGFIESYQCRFDPKRKNLEDLKTLLLEKRDFVLGMLQNPSLLEHDRFTDLLWAVCHLTEELEARQDISLLPPSDIRHIEGDIQRAFECLVREWLAYMEHLKKNYPYMYSLSVRMNPFNPGASAVIAE